MRTSTWQEGGTVGEDDDFLFAELLDTQPTDEVWQRILDAALTSAPGDADAALVPADTDVIESAEVDSEDEELDFDELAGLLGRDADVDDDSDEADHEFAELTEHTDFPEHTEFTDSPMPPEHPTPAESLEATDEWSGDSDVW